MHTYCLQMVSGEKSLENVEEYSVEKMEELLVRNDYQRFVDYVEALEDEKRAWEYMLGLFSENGCEVVGKTIKVIDIEKFSRFLLNCTEEVFDPPKTWEEAATFMHRNKINEYCNFPTVFNGSPYDNIFDALRYSLYSCFYKNELHKFEPKSFTLVGIFSCHL